MRVFVNVICEGHERVFEIACGAGDKTFKWLSLAASNLYAAAAPNGQLRRRDDYRGSTSNVEQHAVNVVLADGVSPHPAALISEYLRDQDGVEITLVSEVSVNNLGTPSSSNWASLAFTSTEDHMGFLYDNVDDAADSKTYDPEDKEATKARAEFMRIIMRGQMLNTKQLAHSLRTAWSKAVILLPKLQEDDILDIQETLFKDWLLLQELFELYAPTGAMDVKEFERFCEHAEVFSARENNLLSTRAFQRVLKAHASQCGGSIKTLDIQSGTFIASILVLAQVRHNDIYEKQSCVHTANGYLNEILKKNFRVLAGKLGLKCLPKETLCSCEFLAHLRTVYDDLIAVFEKFAARHNRDVYTSLPFEHVAELLHEAKLVPTKDISGAEALFKVVTSGAINGRDENVNPPHPPDEYLFPETVEVACLCEYNVHVQNRTDTVAKLNPPKEDADGNKIISPYPILPPNDVESIDILQCFHTALTKLTNTLIVPVEETPVVRGRGAPPGQGGYR